MIVSFEGLDKSGKYTQSKLLQDNLLLINQSSVIKSFPSDDSPVSSLIREQLKINSHQNAFLSMLMSADRQFHDEQIFQWSNDFDVVILDRHSDSGIAYGAAAQLTWEWLYNLESEIMQPDLTFFLDVNCGGRQSKLPDKFEDNLGYLKDVRDMYYEMYEHKYFTKEVEIIKETDKEKIGQIIFKRVKLCMGG